MRRVGLFEAKTRLSEICLQVADNMEPVMITRRGRPFVVLQPLSRGDHKPSDIWKAREAFVKANGPIRIEIPLPRRVRSSLRDPLA